MRKFSALIFHPLDLQIVHVTPLEAMLVLGFAGDLFECGGGGGGASQAETLLPECPDRPPVPDGPG